MSKMDGLTPLIDLAAADGTITAAELDHLILEATMRGVSEADAARICPSMQSPADGNSARPRRARLALGR